MTTFITLIVYFSVLTGGVWKQDHQVEFGTVETGTVNCRLLIKAVRTDLGNMNGERFESAYCREVQQ